MMTDGQVQSIPRYEAPSWADLAEHEGEQSATCADCAFFHQFSEAGANVLLAQVSRYRLKNTNDKRAVKQALRRCGFCKLNQELTSADAEPCESYGEER